jgi:hypothetical protein
MYAGDLGLELNLVVDRDPEQRLIHRGRRGSHNGGASRHDPGNRRFQYRRSASSGSGGILSVAALSGQSNERLAGRHPIALSDQHFGNPNSRSVEGDDGLLAGHQKAGDANGRRETGARGANHADLNRGRRIYLRCEEPCWRGRNENDRADKGGLRSRDDHRAKRSHGRYPNVRPMVSLDSIIASHARPEIRWPNIARRNHTGSGPSNADI